MVKKGLIYILSLAIFGLSGCATANYPVRVQGPLAHGVVAYRPVSAVAGTIPVKPFFAVSDLSDLLESLDLLDLPLDSKKQMLRQIFAKIGYPAKDGAIGELQIGGYFLDGSNLILRFAVFTPGPNGRSPRADKILVVQSNALQGKPDEKGNHPINRQFGAFMDIDSNVSEVYLAFADGRLVTMNNVFNDQVEKAFQANKHVPLNLVNRSDSYLKDERLDNDALVPPMLDEAYHSPNAEESIKIVARLNMSLYWMAQNDLAKAQSILNEVQALNGPQRNEFATVIDRDLPQMLELIKDLEPTAK